VGEACFGQLPALCEHGEADAVPCSGPLKHTLDQGRLTWRHNSVLNHIAGCLKSAFVGKSTVELYCDLDGLQAPGGGSIPADIMVQAQRPDLVIIDQSVYGRFRIALVELTCPWDTDAKRAEECKTARYADLKVELSNQGWDRGLYLIEVGAQGHIVKSVKDRLWSLFRAWLPAGHRSGIGQMIKTHQQDFSGVFVYHISGLQ
jgi:hypothetical protein